MVQGRVIASGKPDELARGDNEEARKFIEASGVDTGRLSRVNRAAPDASDAHEKAAE